MNKRICFTTANCLRLLLVFSLPLYAEAKIELSISSEKFIANKAIKHTQTKNKTNSPDTQEALPGEQLLYTIHYENLGKHAALEAAVNTTIDATTAYKAGSASCKHCKIVYSSDGKHFNSSDKLDSKPESYTHIRWLFDEIAAGEKGQVSYSVVVK